MKRVAVLPAVVAGALAVSARPAAANMAAPPPPTEISGPAVAGERTPLAVREADLVIDCSAGGPTCRLEVTYVIHNPTDAVAGGLAAFYALYSTSIEVTVDGKPAGRPLGEADVAALDAAVTSVSEGRVSNVGWRDDELTRHGVDLSLPPGASARVVVKGGIRLVARRPYYGFALPGGRARHTLLAPDAPDTRNFRLEYLVAPIRTWGAFPAEMTFTLRQPARWAMWQDGATFDEERREGGVTVRRGRIATNRYDVRVDLSVLRPDPVFVGALVAIGGNVDDSTGVRLRAGVEAVIRQSWLASLSAEVELADETGLVLVPLVANSSPWVLVIPSFSIGLGVPVRLLPEVEVGGRFQLDAHLGPVGIVLAMDYYPAMDDDPRRFQVILLGQVSL